MIELKPKDIVVLAIGAAVVLIFSRQIVAKAVSSTVDAAAGVPLGIGDAVGIPRTSEVQCQADLSGHHYWDASFSCPAKPFFKGIWSHLTGAAK